MEEVKNRNNALPFVAPVFLFMWVFVSPQSQGFGSCLQTATKHKHFHFHISSSSQSVSQLSLQQMASPYLWDAWLRNLILLKKVQKILHRERPFHCSRVKIPSIHNDKLSYVKISAPAVNWRSSEQLQKNGINAKSPPPL